MCLVLILFNGFWIKVRKENRCKGYRPIANCLAILQWKNNARNGIFYSCEVCSSVLYIRQLVSQSITKISFCVFIHFLNKNFYTQNWMIKHVKMISIIRTIALHSNECWNFFFVSSWTMFLITVKKWNLHEFRMYGTKHWGIRKFLMIFGEYKIWIFSQTWRWKNGYVSTILSEMISKYKFHE